MTVPGAGRAVPFYCPYCGDEDLLPYGEQAGAFSCAACRRTFALRFLGLAASA